MICNDCIISSYLPRTAFVIKTNYYYSYTTGGSSNVSCFFTKQVILPPFDFRLREMEYESLYKSSIYIVYNICNRLQAVQRVNLGGRKEI